MTINTVDVTTGPYTGNGVTSSFTYDFPIEDESELLVFVNGVPLVVDSQYTVTGVGDPDGGQVTLTSPLTTGFTLFIRSNRVATQNTDFDSQGGFFPDVHERSFDKLTALIQQLESLALRFPENLLRSPLLNVLPSPQENHGLAWDTNGSLINKVINDTVVLGGAIELQFNTIIDMINRTTVSGMNVVWADYVGQSVRVLINNSTSKSGGWWYIIKTLSQAATDGDVIDGRTNHSLDATYCAVLCELGIRKSVMAFGVTAASAKNGIEAASNTQNSIYLPAGQYDVGTVAALAVNDNISIYGDTPTYDPVTDTKGGTWINGVISTAGANTISIFDVGIDARLSAINEGVVFSDPIKLTSLFIDRVIVIAKPAANHCMLIENVERAVVGSMIVYGGIQGVAVKADIFYIGSVFAYDQTTWGFTARYTPPNYKCQNGYVGYVYCGHVNNAKGGGVICMNDQSGAALKNITFDKITIEDGNAGFFVTNGGNATKADNIVINEMNISGVSGFAIQTFGPVTKLKIGRGHLKNCGGSVYTNGGSAEDFELNNICVEGTPAPAVLEGSGHKCHRWTYAGASGPYAFIDNRSTLLQISDFDVRTRSHVNNSGGTTPSTQNAGIYYSARGSLPAMILNRAHKKQSTTAAVATNTELLLYALPAGSSRYSLTLTVMALTVAGTHTRTYQINQGTITLISGSPSSGLVFDVVKTGDNINFKYLFTVGNVDIDATIDAFHEA